MLKEIILLFLVNSLSGIGYSLIGSLYPPLVKVRNHYKYICSS